MISISSATEYLQLRSGTEIQNGAWFRNCGSLSFLVSQTAVPFIHCLVAYMLWRSGIWLITVEENSLRLHPVIPPIVYLFHPLTLQAIYTRDSLACVGAATILTAVLSASRRAIYRPAILAGACIGTYAALYESLHIWSMVIPLAVLQRHQKLKKHIEPFKPICGRDLFGVGALSAIIGIIGLLTYFAWEFLAFLKIGDDGSFRTYYTNFFCNVWSFQHNYVDYNLTWYVGIVMFRHARPMYTAFMNLSLLMQSLPFSLLFMRAPHRMIWILIGIIPLLEKSVPGEMLAFSIAVMLIYGQLVINHKVMIIALLVINVSSFVFQLVKSSWMEYYTSNSNVALVSGSGTTIALSLLWVTLYNDVHRITFYQSRDRSH